MKHPSERRPAIFVLNDPTAPRLNPELAKEIGLNESLLFLQLEFWLRMSGKLQEDGKYWIYESVTDIQSVFCFLSRSTVNRTILSLIELELLQVGNFNKHRYDQTRWFTLNRAGIDRLQSIQVGEWWVCQNDTGSGQVDPEACQDDTGSNQNDTGSGQDEPTIPDLSTDLSSDLSSEKEDPAASAPVILDDSLETENLFNPPEPIQKETVQEKLDRLRDQYNITPREDVAVPLEMVPAVQAARSEAGGVWTVPVAAGGTDAVGPAMLRSWLESKQVDPSTVPDDLQRQWTAALSKLAAKLNTLTSGQAADAVLVVLDPENPEFSYYTYSNPSNKKFAADWTEVALRLLNDGTGYLTTQHVPASRKGTYDGYLS